MENEIKKPKVQNMNDIVNFAEEAAAETAAARSTARPSQAPQTMYSSSEARSSRVSSGMRSAYRAQETQSSSRMQTITLDRSASQGGTARSAASQTAGSVQRSSQSSSGAAAQAQPVRQSQSAQSQASRAATQTARPVQSAQSQASRAVTQSARPAQSAQSQASRTAQGTQVRRPQSSQNGASERRPSQASSQNRSQRPAQAAPSEVQRKRAEELHSEQLSNNRARGTRKYSDIVDERKNRSEDAAGRGKTKKKKKGGFKKFLLIYSIVLVVLIGAGLIVFSSFLKTMEDNQPNNVAASVVKTFEDSGKLTSYLNENKDKAHCLEDVSNLIDQCVANVSGKTIQYQENADFRETAPSYDIMADGKTVAKVTLKADGKASFGQDTWKVDTIDFVSFIEGTKAYEINVPQGSSVTVNGNTVDSSYVTNEGVPEILVNSTKFMATVPTFTTYTVSGFTKAPAVEAVNSSGTTLALQESETAFTAGLPVDQAFLDEVDPLVNKAIEIWATHFIHMSSNLNAYIMKDTDLYDILFGSEDMNVIDTNLYLWENITGYEITSKSATNYIRYAEDCFTVDVKYHMDMYFDTESYEDNNQNLDATWVWVRDGDSWSISDIRYH